MATRCSSYWNKSTVNSPHLKTISPSLVCIDYQCFVSHDNCYCISLAMAFFLNCFFLVSSTSKGCMNSSAKTSIHLKFKNAKRNSANYIVREIIQ